MRFNIQTAREKAGLSQAQLGELLGVSSVTISNWENSKSRHPIKPHIYNAVNYVTNYSYNMVINKFCPNKFCLIQELIDKENVRLYYYDVVESTKQLKADLKLRHNDMAKMLELNKFMFSIFHKQDSKLSMANLKYIFQNKLVKMQRDLN